MTETPRFPLQPLTRAARTETMTGLAEAVGVSSHTLRRWAQTGIPEPAADRAAIAIGSHPAYLWPKQWNQANQP